MRFWVPNSPLSGLPYVKQGRSARSSTWDRTGGNRDFATVAPGDTHVMADLDGAGVIEHIWMTTRCYAPHYLRKLVLEMFWDGEDNPSVRAPLGDFFGTGHAACAHYVSLPLSMVFGPRRGPKGPFAAAMNSYFPMPFGTGARIQLRNESEEPIQNLFYYVDYELTGEPAPDDVGRFHAFYRQEKPAIKVAYQPAAGGNDIPPPWELPGVNLTGDQNYVILDATGTGHYVGCVLSIDNFDASNQPYTWPGEGDDMIFIDGDTWPPSLHGTGTEDYFNAAWGFPSGAYAGPYHGITLASSVQEHFGLWSMYRFHIEDPVRFRTSIRVTIEHGHANDQGNDYSSVAYWYQIEPHAPHPGLPAVAGGFPGGGPSTGYGMSEVRQPAAGRAEGRRKATIRDVAAAAGVSVTTVSHVLNEVDRARIADETRARVREAAEALSYTPSPLARGLRTRRTKTLGLLSDHIATTPHAGKIILGAQETGLKRGWVLLMFNTEGDPGTEQREARAMLQYEVEGVLYASMYHRVAELPAALHGVPTVMLDARSEDPAIPAVVPDEVTGGRTAVTELLRAGHRRIGFATNLDDIPATHGRLKGYQDALRAAGISFDPGLVVAGESDPGPRGGYQAARTLLSLPDPPTALFCFNDRMAMGAYRAAAELGLSIPADLSVIGFDNQEIIAAGLYPGLTTVALPHYEMGQWAVRTLLRLIESPGGRRAGTGPHLMRCPLVRRDSTGPPPGA